MGTENTEVQPKPCPYYRFSNQTGPMAHVAEIWTQPGQYLVASIPQASTKACLARAEALF